MKATKHYVKPKCKYKCTFLQISDELWLCPHAAYGAAAELMGAVEEGRRLLERAGGYDLLLARIQTAAYEAKQKRKAERAKAQAKADGALRYDQAPAL